MTFSLLKRHIHTNLKYEKDITHSIGINVTGWLWNLLHVENDSRERII